MRARGSRRICNVGGIRDPCARVAGERDYVHTRTGSDWKRTEGENDNEGREDRYTGMKERESKNHNKKLSG
jgi:hypothetical protein